MSEIIKNRREILFIYDVVNANPNGDPLDENKPRIDEETGLNIVTDVRFKRTIRDYLHDFKGYEVFVRGIKDENGILKTREKRLNEIPLDKILQCIDIRLFGATISVEKKTQTYTGPVQFKFGRSFHKVSNKFIKGTTVFPSGEGKTQGTFTEEYRLPYSLICFYGIVNENSAKCTNLTEFDIDLLMDGIWNGTKNLITRSKAGQMPRLLLEVIYKETNFHIGELDRLIGIKSPKQDEELRDVSELSLEIGQLKSKLEKNSDSIMCIRYKHDDRLKLTLLDQEISLESISDKIKFCPFSSL